MAVLEMEIGRNVDHLKEVSIDLATGSTAITLIPTREDQPGQGIELSRGEFLAALAAFHAADAAMGELARADEGGITATARRGIPSDR